MINEVAIKYIKRLYAMADLTDEYGDMVDTEPYEEAIAWVAQALEEQSELQYENHLLSCELIKLKDKIKALEQQDKLKDFFMRDCESCKAHGNEFFNFDSEIIKRNDCISREEAIKTIQRYGVGSQDFEDYTPEQAERFVIQKLSELPSVGKDINAPTTDCVSREEALNCVRKFAVDIEDGSEYWRSRVNDYLAAIDAEITDLSPVKPITQWHMIKTRPLTDEEKEVYGKECEFIYDCKMPDDEQEVLIKTDWGIEKTTYYTNDGCFFEDYEDEDDVVAWTELPEWEE